MLLNVNPKDGLPVYLQLMQQIKHQVVSGTLMPGDKLPSAKDLAVRLLINANTVSKAYTELEREGVVTSRRGSGTFIADAPPPRTEEQRAELLKPLLTRVAVEAKQLGLGRDAVVDELKNAWREIDEE